MIADRPNLRDLGASKEAGRSLYEPGVRSKTWVKAKCADWLTGHAAHRHG